MRPERESRLTRNMTGQLQSVYAIKLSLTITAEWWMRGRRYVSAGNAPQVLPIFHYYTTVQIDPLILFYFSIQQTRNVENPKFFFHSKSKACLPYKNWGTGQNKMPYIWQNVYGLEHRFRVYLTRFKSQLCHQLTVWPWECDFTCLCFCFFSCKMEIMLIVTIP